MRKKMFSTKPGLSTIVALFTTSLIACAGDIEGDDFEDEASEHVHSAALTQQQWTFCANQGERCYFDGTARRQVRYGANGRTTTKTLRSGSMCSNNTFGVRYGTGNRCEVLLDVEVDAGTTTPSKDAGSMGGMGTSDAGSMGGMSSGDAGMMPYVDKSKIPTGSPGVGTVQISDTDETPQPYEIGAFRTSCEFSHMNFDDALVFPGQPGKAHLHAYFGNTGTNANSTSESLRNSGNSTCRGGIANRSAYWVPAVLDKNGAPVKPHSMQVYYKTGYEGIRPNQVNVFPQGIHVIAGDAKSAAAGQSRAFWSCETYNGHPNAIPDCQAGDKVIMMVQFPQCWNGKDLDSTDHKSHMSYPVNGACPSTHPVAIPEISFNVYYEVPAGTKSSSWRLASDMYDSKLPGGYSAHGDWMEGWDRQIAETFVKYCDQASKDCKSHLLGDGRMIYNSLEPNE
jgi:hypothetical protein